MPRQIRNTVTESVKKNCGKNIGEKLKNQLSSNVFIVHFEVTIILLSPKF